ncbi:MAG: hypothetical protein U0V70_15145 [Terriglobia bacterium]
MSGKDQKKFEVRYLVSRTTPPSRLAAMVPVYSLGNITYIYGVSPTSPRRRAARRQHQPQDKDPTEEVLGN